jgi:hypothetical protein
MAVLGDAEAVLTAKFAAMRRLGLNERQWREYLGIEARALGYGGIAAVARAAGGVGDDGGRGGVAGRVR